MSEDKKHWSRHPVLVVAISFLLSGVIGAAISYQFNEAAKHRENDQREFLARQESVRTFSKLLYHRRVRAELLASSIIRGASETEIISRKNGYDQAYIEWNTNIQNSLFIAREIYKEDEYSLLENLVETRLVFGILSPLDSCLTRSFDEQMRNGGGSKVWINFNGKVLLNDVLNCGYALSEAMYRLSNGTVQKPDAEAQILGACQ